MKNKLKNLFIKTYQKSENLDYYFAPGRVNLIGEHTDYNGGYVLPFAINLGTYAVVSLREDNYINFFSANFDEHISIKINKLNYNSNHKWANYPKGVLKTLTDAGFKIDKGLDILFYGNLPTGAGLSSSASFELVTAVMINKLFDFKISKIDLVKYCLKAENEYMGLNCGIMDQFAIGMGKKDNAILLNTKTLDYQYIPLNIKNHSIFVVDSIKRRELVNSEFNIRQKQCKIALNKLQNKLQIKNLCDIEPETFEKFKYIIDDKIVRKRAKHVIYENQRTLKFALELKKNSNFYLGVLMLKSHISLDRNYEVTGYELNELSNIIRQTKGVLAARMTGAGFGGCAIAIIDKKYVPEFIKNVKQNYYEKTKLKPEFYYVKPSDGAEKAKF